MKLVKEKIGILSLIMVSIATQGQTTQFYGPDGYVTIENGANGFIAEIDPGDRFSRDHDVAGDINGDGVLDLVVGARSDDDGATDAGAVYILFMNNDGTVQSNQKISMLSGDFAEVLNPGNFFGYGVAGIGDYDNDGVPDIAVSAPVPPNMALYIIHLNSNGTVKDFVKTMGIPAQGLSAIGDLNGDGRIDLVACEPGSDVGGTDMGGIKLLFFNENSVLEPLNTVAIDALNGGFGDGLNPGDEFGGREAAMLGDIDGNGSLELAVGAFMSDGGKGAIWILSLDSENFQVLDKVKVTEGLNGFDEELTSGVNPNGTEGANFGHALAAVGDVNGDGIPDLMTGANQQFEGWGYVLYLNTDRTVKSFVRINNVSGGFGLVLEAEERFSRSISFVGDLQGNGTMAVNYGGGAGESGTLYLLFFKPCDLIEESENFSYTGGNILFSNSDEVNNQTENSALAFEQCAFAAFETDATYFDFNQENGICICLDAAATLEPSNSGTSYINGCSDLHSDIVNADMPQVVRLFPNPTDSKIYLYFDNFHQTDNIVVRLFDGSGRIVQTEKAAFKEMGIDVSEFSKGLYFAVIDINNKVHSAKIIVE
ncbi:MAG: T9SS type A sorting domain-containing protein [Cryomorphaceae bacterium]|nr:T9SS type A sorting domain-containing protein [Cryomorphaceae bacterium]